MNGKMVTRGKGCEGHTPHEPRHTQATLLQGIVNPKAAQHRLGHSQISMTMNTYSHFLDANDILNPRVKWYDFPVSIKRHDYMHLKLILNNHLYKFLYCIVQ